jgi:hypothetical protein
VIIAAALEQDLAAQIVWKLLQRNGPKHAVGADGERLGRGRRAQESHLKQASSVTEGELRQRTAENVGSYGGGAREKNA